MTTAAAVWVDVLPSMRGFAPALRKQTQTAAATSGDAAGKGFGKRFSQGAMGPMRNLALAAGGAFAAAKIGGFLKDAVMGASDLNETVSKVGQIFGPAARDIEAFSSRASTTLGQTKQQAMDANATFGIFGKSAGLAGQDLSGFTTRLTTLAADMASFNNTSPEQAITAIGAALRGESEPIRAYGVLLDDASLRQEALRQGLVKTTKEALTPQQRVLAAQALILKQTSDQQGDFARTSQGMANQQRILSARVVELRDRIGAALLPVLVRGANFLTSTVVPAFESTGRRVRDAFNSSRPALEKFGSYVADRVVPAAVSFAASFRENVLPALRDLAGFILREVIPRVAALVGWYVAHFVPAQLAVGKAIFEVVGFLHDQQDIVVPLAAGVAAFAVTLKVVRLAILAKAAVVKGITAVTKGWAAAQAILNAVMLMNPFVLVAALVIGLSVAFVVAYKKSETFREAIGKAWSFIKNAFISGIQFVSGAFLGFVSMLLNGTARIARALHLPIADSLTKAATEFDEFKDKANASLEALKDKDVRVGVQLDKGAQDAIKAFGAKNVRVTSSGHLLGLRTGSGTIRAYAHGGPVGRGRGTRDDMPSLLTRGEHVWTTREVAAVGGHKAVAQLRKAALGGFGGLGVATDFPTRATRARFIGRIRETRDAAGRGIDQAVTDALSRYINTRAKAAATSGPMFHPGGSLGRVAFPLPRGSYSVGVPLGGYPGHTGQDFPAPTGTPVYAPFAGMFRPTSLGNRSYGNFADLYGGGGMRFIGAHLSSFARGPGMVRAGEMLGRVGSTGNSTGPHLHAEFRRNGAVLNPRNVLSYGGAGGGGALTTRQLAAMTKAAASEPPEVRVFIGDRELTDIVRVEVDGRDAALADALTYRPA